MSGEGVHQNEVDDHEPHNPRSDRSCLDACKALRYATFHYDHQQHPDQLFARQLHMEICQNCLMTIYHSEDPDFFILHSLFT